MKTRTAISMMTVSLTLPILVLLGACGDRSVGPETSFPEGGIHVAGALNTVFDELNETYLDWTGDPSVLALTVYGKGGLREQKEYATLRPVFSLPRGNTGWEVGEYTFEKGSIEEPGHVEGFFFVTIFDDTRAEEVYVFELTSLYLKIESNDGETISFGYSFLGSTDAFKRVDRGRIQFVPIEGDGRINIQGTVENILIPGP